MNQAEKALHNFNQTAFFVVSENLNASANGMVVGFTEFSDQDPDSQLDPYQLIKFINNTKNTLPKTARHLRKLLASSSNPPAAVNWRTSGHMTAVSRAFMDVCQHLGQKSGASTSMWM